MMGYHGIYVYIYTHQTMILMGYITVSNQFGDMGKREIPKFSMAILIRKQLGFDPTNSRGWK